MKNRDSGVAEARVATGRAFQYLHDFNERQEKYGSIENKKAATWLFLFAFCLTLCSAPKQVSADRVCAPKDLSNTPERA